MGAVFSSGQGENEMREVLAFWGLWKTLWDKIAPYEVEPNLPSIGNFAKTRARGRRRRVNPRRGKMLVIIGKWVSYHVG